MAMAATEGAGPKDWALFFLIGFGFVVSIVFGLALIFGALWLIVESLRHIHDLLA